MYGEVLERLAEQGATWVQFDEPCFVEDRSSASSTLRLAYEELAKVRADPDLVKTYFDHAGDAYGVLRDLRSRVGRTSIAGARTSS